MLPIRVFFVKKENARYISHLDLQRAVVRGIKRSGLHAAYSEGFNPHIKLSFGMPLPLFQEGENEFFDIIVNDELSCTEIENKLRSAFPPELGIIKAVNPVNKAKDIHSAEYKIKLITSLKKEEIITRLSQKAEVIKKTKKGNDTVIDISAKIFRIDVLESTGGLTVTVTLPAGSDDYLNPQYIVNFFGTDISSYDITRLRFIDKSGNTFE